MGKPLRETLIVDGALAFRMQRAAAARAGVMGREVLTLPRMAARLAGGFLEPAGPDVVFPAIRHALATGSFAELHRVSALPGTARAVFETLEHIWSADLDLHELAQEPGRLADLAAIEAAVRQSLNAAWLLPRELRDAAVRQIAHAPAIFGRIVIDGISDIEPVWRPLIVALTEAGFRARRRNWRFSRLSPRLHIRAPISGAKW